MLVLKKRVRIFVILFSFLCYNNFFDDLKNICDSFDSIVCNSQNIQKQNKATHVFQAEVFSYELLKFQKDSLKPFGEQLKRVKVPRFQSFLNISHILFFFMSLITLILHALANLR